MRQSLVHAGVLSYNMAISFFYRAAIVRIGAWFVTDVGNLLPLTIILYVNIVILKINKFNSNIHRINYLIGFGTDGIGWAATYFPEFYKARMSAGLIFKILNTKPAIDNYSTSGKKMVCAYDETKKSKIHF
jgi:hypothetical protein